IFYFGSPHGIGVDPLAASYGKLFPRWQSCARTVAAVGEALPFRSQSFDIVLCDNVVDHAESPSKIVAELTRILAPGGLMYFTVNIHHPVYAVAAGGYVSLWAGGGARQGGRACELEGGRGAVRGRAFCGSHDASHAQRCRRSVSESAARDPEREE